MKKRWDILIFVTGLALGCWFGSYRDSLFKSASSSSNTYETKLRETRPERTPHERKWQGYGELVAQMDRQEQEKVLEALDPHDRGSALESLLTQAGPNGLDLDLKEMVTKILTKWGMEDFDGAWTWVHTCKPEAMRIFAVKILLEDLAGRDSAKALVLHYNEVETSIKYESDVPDILIKASASEGTDKFINLLSRFKFSSSSNMMGSDLSTWVEFSPDFEFRRAADATVSLVHERGRNYPERFPSNFINEWGKRDLQAATDWMINFPRLPFNDWGNLYDSAQDVLGTKEAGKWMAATIDLAGDKNGGMMQMLINFSSSDNIKAIAASIPDTVKRDRFLEDLIAASGGDFGDENCTGTALWLMSTPAIRQAALRKIPSHNDWRPNDNDLKHLGITREQFNEILPPAEFQRE